MLYRQSAFKFVPSHHSCSCFPLSVHQGPPQLDLRRSCDRRQDIGHCYCCMFLKLCVQISALILAGTRIQFIKHLHVPGCLLCWLKYSCFLSKWESKCCIDRVHLNSYLLTTLVHVSLSMYTKDRRSWICAVPVIEGRTLVTATVVCSVSCVFKYRRWY